MTCTECGRPGPLRRHLCRACYNRCYRAGTHLHHPSMVDDSHRAAVVADVEWILTTETADLPTVAARLGTTPGALERLLYRAGRGDLVRRMRVRRVAMARGGGA